MVHTHHFKPMQLKTREVKLGKMPVLLTHQPGKAHEYFVIRIQALCYSMIFNLLSPMLQESSVSLI
jgi:hypothetical protein